MSAKKTSSGVFWDAGVQKIGQQLTFAFTYGKRLVKSIKRGFIWIRPDGNQVQCRDTRALVRAIMNYDGAWMRRLVQQAAKIGIRAV